MATTQPYRSDPAVSPELGGVFDAVSDAQWAVGFDAGYRRAVNNMVADVALIAAEVGRELASGNEEVRQALRRFRARIEQHLEGESDADHRPTSTSEGFVDGGLGI